MPLQLKLKIYLKKKLTRPISVRYFSFPPNPLYSMKLAPYTDTWLFMLTVKENIKITEHKKCSIIAQTSLILLVSMIQ